MESIKCYCDGACKGNPGLGSWGYLITEPWIEESGIIEGESTNNTAEYTALIELLKRLNELNIYNAIVYSDSKLIVNTVNEKWKCKKPHLKPLCNKAKRLLRGRTLEWTSRDNNTIADKLASKPLNT